MRAGQLDRQVSLQSFALGTSGDPLAGTWTTEATVWAGRMDARGTERAMGGMAQAAEATQAYRVRYRPDIKTTWRLVDGSDLWDIVAVVPNGRDDELVLLVRRLDPDDVT